MKNIRMSSFVLCASMALVPAAMLAQPSGTSAGAGQSTDSTAMSSAKSGSNGFSMADKHFLKTAAQGGMAEVKLGQLAADKGGTEAVKDFGNKMVQDHTKLNDAMMPFIQQAGLSAPTKLSAKDQALYDRLNKLSGAAFDSAYTSAMMKDHSMDKAEFKKEMASTKNTQLRDAVKQGEQTIDEHLEMVHKLASTHDKSDQPSS